MNISKTYITALLMLCGAYCAPESTESDTATASDTKSATNNTNGEKKGMFASMINGVSSAVGAVGAAPIKGALGQNNKKVQDWIKELKNFDEESSKMRYSVDPNIKSEVEVIYSAKSLNEALSQIKTDKIKLEKATHVVYDAQKKAEKLQSTLQSFVDKQDLNFMLFMMHVIISLDEETLRGQYSDKAKFDEILLQNLGELGEYEASKEANAIQWKQKVETCAKEIQNMNFRHPHLQEFKNKIVTYILSRIHISQLIATKVLFQQAQDVQNISAGATEKNTLQLSKEDMQVAKHVYTNFIVKQEADTTK